MRKTLKEIAKLIEGELVGDGSVVITGVAGIKEADSGDITFLANPKYASLLNTTGASAVIVAKDLEISLSAKPVIRTDNPSLAFSKIILKSFSLLCSASCAFLRFVMSRP